MTSTKNRPRRPCTSCGNPTRAEGWLCRDCKPSTAKQQENTCLVCKKRTWAKDRMHPRCRPPKDKESLTCLCGKYRLSGTRKVCDQCAKARSDDESPWDLAASGGYWRPVGSIQEWVPLLVEDSNVQIDDRTRECAFEGCGVWFVQRKVTQHYCSERCQKAADRGRRREREAA